MSDHPIRFLSVCSGIEAASVAWHLLGWQPIAFSEIDPFPCAVLAHRFPNVPNWGDMTAFKDWPDATPDVLVGGTPCQAFSVAGLRKGLDDPRGNLTLTYLAIADRYRPEWVVWENVPGVLSQDKGRAFSAFLGGLAELGYGFAYRVLDAQYFGVAQRRRRVFVVGHLGDWRRAAAVLFERESLSGDPAPCREAGKETTYSTAPSLTGSGRGTERAGESREQDCVIPMPHAAISPAIKARDSKGASSDGDGDGAILVPMVAHGYHESGQGRWTEGPLGLRAEPGGMHVGMQVRRLTLTECARLQGLPDDYLDIPYRGKPAADGPRYKALGNSMAVPVMAWLGSRIQMMRDVTDRLADL